MNKIYLPLLLSAATFLFIMALCPLESLLTGMTFSEDAIHPEPGIRIILAADLPGGSYTQDDLQETANNVSRRVNALGLAEATVQIAGDSRIWVEIPGVIDQQLVLDTIQQTALLEFVDFSGLHSGQVQNLVGQYILTDAQLEQRGGNVPEGNYAYHPITDEPFETIMTGGGLQNASAQYNSQMQQWTILFELSDAGSQIFGPYTATHIGQPLAIVLDGKVISAPTIQSELTTGGIIVGNFSEDEAKTLALQLRSGALPVPMVIESIENVGQ